MNSEPSETSVHDELCDARREIALLRDQAAFFTEDHNKQVAQLESNLADQLSRANRRYDRTFDRFKADIDLLRAERDRVESDRADSASEEVKELQEAVHKLMREKERSEEKLAELEYSYTVASQGGKSRQEDLGRIQELQREKRELVTMVETLRKEREHELHDADGKRGMEAVRATNQELRVENERLVREQGNMAASLADLRETNRRLMAERAYLATDREDVWAENALVVKERDVLRQENGALGERLKLVGEEKDAAVRDGENMRMDLANVGTERDTGRRDRMILLLANGILRDREKVIIGERDAAAAGMVKERLAWAEKHDILRRKILELEEKVVASAERNGELRTMIARLEEEKDTSVRAHKALKKEIAELEKEKVTLEESHDISRKRIIELEKAGDTSVGRHNELQGRISQLEMEVTTSTGQHSILGKKIMRLEAEGMTAAIQRSALVDRIVDLAKTQVTSAEKEDKLQSRVAQLEEERATSTEEHDELQGEIVRLNQELATSLEKCNTSQKRLVQLEKEKHATVDKYAGLKRRIVETEGELKTWVAKHTVSQMRIVELEEERAISAKVLFSLKRRIAQLEEKETMLAADRDRQRDEAIFALREKLAASSEQNPANDRALTARDCEDTVTDDPSPAEDQSQLRIACPPATYRALYDRIFMPDHMIFRCFPLVENSLRSSQEFLKLSVECALNKLGDLEVSLSVIYWVTEVVRTRKRFSTTRREQQFSGYNVDYGVFDALVAIMRTTFSELEEQIISSIQSWPVSDESSGIVQHESHTIPSQQVIAPVPSVRRSTLNRGVAQRPQSKPTVLENARSFSLDVRSCAITSKSKGTHMQVLERLTGMDRTGRTTAITPVAERRPLQPLTEAYIARFISGPGTALKSLSVQSSAIDRAIQEHSSGFRTKHPPHDTVKLKMPPTLTLNARSIVQTETPPSSIGKSKRRADSAPRAASLEDSPSPSSQPEQKRRRLDYSPHASSV